MVSQSFAMASPSPGILDSRERSATVKGPAMAYKRRLDDRGDLRRASGRAEHRAVPVTALRSPRSFRDRFPHPHALVTINGFTCKRILEPGDALPERPCPRLRRLPAS